MEKVQEEQAILQRLLQASAAYHQHLCPRQVLGVRMGLFAGELLGVSAPQTDKRLFTFIETDGCFLDGVAVSTNCTVGGRTLHILDYGKMAATFVDRNTMRAVRISPHPLARQLCAKYAADTSDRWHAYLYGYQEMPEAELFSYQWVEVTLSLEKIISTKKAKAICARCGEEIFNGREALLNGEPLCQPCAGAGYYQLVEPEAQRAC